MEARAALANEIIVSASKILESFFRKRDLRIEMKDGGNDPVTEADLAVDELVRNRLSQAFPDDLILTEETSDGDFTKYLDHPAVWICDPLDGTKNFSRGIANYASALAFVNRGQPVFGALAFPGGKTAILRPPEGTNKVRRVSATSDIRQAVISMDFPKKAVDRERGAQIAVKTLMADVQSFRSMGSAVADFWRVADGQLDAYIHPGLSPWDAAAPAAFVLAANGRITRLDGSPWNVFCPDILATNGHLHNDLLTLINS